jgi:hypothetical protein
VFSFLMAQLATVEVAPPLPNPRWVRWDHPGSGLWPSIDFIDAGDQRVVPGFVVDCAQRIRRRLVDAELPCVLGHADFEAQNLRWRHGQVWAVHDWDGPRTYLGVTCPRFPNLLFLGGPHTPFANIPRGIEDQVDFVTGLVKHMIENGYERVESAEDVWTKRVLRTAEPFLVADSSWFKGANIPGKADRFLLYIGGLVNYREKAAEVASNGYEGFVMRKASQPTKAG